MAHRTTREHESSRSSAYLLDSCQQASARLQDDRGTRDHWNRKHGQRFDSAIDTIMEIKNLTEVLLKIPSLRGCYGVPAGQ